MTEEEQAEQGQSAQVQVQQSKNNNQTILIVALVIVVAIIALLLFQMLGGGDSGPGNGSGQEIALPTPEPGKPSATVTAADGVNVRAGPGTDYDVIGVLPNGTSVEIIGRSQDGQWWVVAVPNAAAGQGWVSAQFVSVQNATGVPIVPAPGDPAPTPSAPAPLLLFSVDPASITNGDCATLSWKVENVREVYVYPTGDNWQDHPVTGDGNQQVCPTETTAYEMRAVMQDGSVVTREVTVQVSADNPLAATRWQLSAMYVNQVPFPGTTLSIAFDGAGGVSGNGGCNDFNGVYTLQGSDLTIGPLSTTRRSCGEEADGQEAQYLSALQSSATFAISGNQLIIYDAGGQEILRYNRS